MATAAPSIRARVQAASARIARVKRLDRLATAVITLGGIFIVAGVSFIFVFIIREALPLFLPARGRPLGPLAMAAGPAGAEAARSDPRTLAFGVDEYQRYLYRLTADGRLAFSRIADGTLAREEAPAGLAGATLVAASRSLMHDHLAAATADGRVALLQVLFRPRHEQQRLVDLDIEVRERAVVEIDPGRRPIRALSYEDHGGRLAVAAQVADGEVVLWRRSEEDGGEDRRTLATRDGEPISILRLAPRGDALAAATPRGNLYFWEFEPEVRLTDVVAASSQPLTAVEWALGGVSLLVGDRRGGVSAWFRVRRREEDVDLSLVRAHAFPAQGAAILAIGPSSRDKGFVTAAADGSLVLRHLTSERTVLSFPATGTAVAGVLMAPRGDAAFTARADGRFARYEIRAPHADVSAAALLRPVWYEGYARPEYVWQSTGSTDEFEPKFSLVPLIFGTIKGTFYALLFAVPIAVMGALYTSQFAHPSIRQRVKPVVEIMAALPSVVVGFIAGLWLAARVERELMPVLLMLLLLPAFGTAGILFWDRLPQRLRARLRPGAELLAIVPLCLLGVLVALRLGPPVEGALFSGDLKAWLGQALGLVYDQRNSLVVGLAMGFAVIPIIFTISEDSFSSVPSHLTAASLALGASRWQTALRVVLPTASPGVFSAVMVGFGRAVGETMIVLMATGNTPVLDWSIFNGMRTLSANIAVEIPEAPHGGTLYRVLFLAGGVLFLMTFAVNTVAELVRQRLRERYRAL
jgi:phosphate transport system permease protein